MDVAKYLAIFLVVLAHSIQYSHIEHDEVWKNNEMTRLIISFHMPLFMIISGYFFFSSLRQTFGGMLWKKIRQLLIPAAVFGMVTKLGVGTFHGWFSQVWIFAWYLKCLFFCYLTTWLAYRLTNHKTGGVILFIINAIFLISVMPEWWAFPKMYLFFCIGMILRKHPLIEYRWTLVLSGLIFLLLYPLWKTEYSMYFYDSYFLPVHDGMWQDALKNLLRILMGTTGTLFVLSTLQRIFKHRNCKYAYLGSYTMGIYLMQEWIIQQTTGLINALASFMPYNLVYILYAICMLLVMTLIVHLLSRWEWCRLYLLGMK